MPLTLEIFAPLDLRQAYTAQPAKEALSQQLRQRHWQDTRSTFPALELQEQFWTQHASFHRELTCDLRPKVPLNAAEVPGVAGVERIDMWVQVTGECLVSCTYTLEPTALDSGDAFRAYHRLDAHFRRVFSTVAAEDERASLLGKLPSGADDVLDRDIIGTSPGPHWTHGVYVHVAVAPDSLLCADKLKALAGETMQTVTVVRPGGGAALLEARVYFGWETTALSTNDAEEGRTIAGLVKLMGYVWEIHWVVNALAIAKIQGIQQSGEKASLEDVRRFRQYTAALLGVCKEANFTMTGRFVHMARCITTQWNVAELNTSIDANTALLDLMYEGLEADRKDRRDVLMNRFLATLALLTVVSVTNDFVTFVIQNAAKSQQYWFALTTNPQSLTPVLILLGTALVMVTLLALVGIVIWMGAVIWKWASSGKRRA